VSANGDLVSGLNQAPNDAESVDADVNSRLADSPPLERAGDPRSTPAAAFVV
jgi:hypothetical protein